MTTSLSVNELPCRHTADQVLRRKAELAAFFRDDWSRLRRMILTLEEDVWREDTDAQEHALPVADQSLVETRTEFQLPSASPRERSSRDEADRISSPVTATEPAAMDSVAPDRLSELALQIERRIKVVNAARR